ncbi:hypothetical protein SUGI_1177880 [Cryptomeria japonica]|nr:hypothetical protein SUGI_1177880 [Cryptomeria japonica]
MWALPGLSVELKMRMAMMANNSASRSTEILNAAANAITSINPRRPPPHQHGRWKGYWSRFWCFGPQKRTKRIVPAYHVQEGNATEALTNGAQQAGYGATNDLLSAYQLYPGSPAGSLLSPRSGFSGSAPSSPFPDLEFPAQWKVLHSAKDSPFSRNEHSNPFNYRSATSGTSIFSKGSNAFFSATSANFKLDHVSQRWSFGGQSSIEPQLTGEAFVCCNSENMEQERHLETNKCCTNVIHKSSVDILVKFPMENSQMQMEQELNRASFELVTDEIKLVTDEITKASSRPIEVLVERLPLSCTEAQNSYAGEYSTSSNRCVREDIHLTELALPNNQTEVSTIDPLKCFTGHARDGVVKD